MIFSLFHLYLIQIHCDIPKLTEISKKTLFNKLLSANNVTMTVHEKDLEWLENMSRIPRIKWMKNWKLSEI